MEIEKAKAIMTKLLIQEKKQPEDYRRAYADGILDFFNEVTRVEVANEIANEVKG